MKRLLITLLAAAAATPALAQHAGHGQPGAAPAPTCTPEHAAMGHCQMPPATPAPAPARATCTPEHAAMGHCTPAAPQHADRHAGHEMQGATGADIPDGPPPPEALSGPAHAQDLIFDPREAARSRAEMIRAHGGFTASKFLLDQAELTIGDGQEGYAWDAQFWHGGDINKLWLKTEGEGSFGDALEHGEVQALYSRAIDPWFDVQAGVRQDFGSASDRTYLTLGLQGLAPYWFELEAAAFLSTEGELTARFEAEYDLRLTQTLILQPKAEIDLSFQDMPDIGIGAGLSSASAGARLRYEFYPETGPAAIAPYVGVEYERALGRTADYRRAEEGSAGGLRFVAGLRTWF